ncbi:DUF1187 family protein [Klebsiella michiganensis]|uniref:DUF1187 family protein n=1 Tax=Klebsiella TaxID=570 RepID=UPI0021698323|nr:DUF1187 family protein [Klebsiella variicola]UVW51678.1 DUF1187 family protein [Klebsiella variicola]HBM3231508.1 DUF1187 family protein [Klebsiella michiganensis]
MFKITATIIKPGGTPAEWLRFSKDKMTREQCEKMLFRDKEAGKSFGDKVRLENFRCVKAK